MTSKMKDKETLNQLETGQNEALSALKKFGIIAKDYSNGFAKVLQRLEQRFKKR